MCANNRKFCWSIGEKYWLLYESWPVYYERAWHAWPAYWKYLQSDKGKRSKWNIIMKRFNVHLGFKVCAMCLSKVKRWLKYLNECRQMNDDYDDILLHYTNIVKLNYFYTIVYYLIYKCIIWFLFFNAHTYVGVW